ncbi:S-layer homology domain-containing protein [Paenibacillus eucommiae]|uniref:S-layer homology domain-containing protein n=1 Tax=Paenibacillus eucommiae TaxID=1355755 RepID=A0ABS4ISG9_9BACL|nr:S-layer homology domain-containing protein [Paenibacillus eucommiae]MBP1990525.1 hypothetical protein [Paenibacillus eucommiae]
MKVAKRNFLITVIVVLALLLNVVSPSMTVDAANVEFKDVSNSYAKQEIYDLVKEGIVSGYEDGTFQPEKAMSRAELAKIIVLSMGLEENPAKAAAFSDVSPSSWYRGYVGALVESGITQGTSGSTFAPDAKVTREELVVFFIRALGLEALAGRLEVDSKLADIHTVADWARQQVSLAFQIGFVNGIEDKDGTLKFSPKENAQRQALARLAYEFKKNQSSYVAKAEEISADPAGPASTNDEIVSLSAVDNSTFEVVFAKDIAEVNKEDFKFDNGLIVKAAALKSGSKTIVVLQTSAQTSGAKYSLTYKGKSSGKTVNGAAAMFGGGGGGGGWGGTAPVNTVQQQLASGNPQTSVTITAAGTYGPANGKITAVEKLIVDLGKSGEVTLQNINADYLEVRSDEGIVIKLLKTFITELKVDASNKAPNVRINADGASWTEMLHISRPNTILHITGSGRINLIKVEEVAGNANVTVDNSGNVGFLETDAHVNLYGDASSLAGILIVGNGTFQMDEGLQQIVKAKAIEKANQAVQTAFASGNGGPGGGPIITGEPGIVMSVEGNVYSGKVMEGPGEAPKDVGKGSSTSIPLVPDEVNSAVIPSVMFEEIGIPVKAAAILEAAGDVKKESSSEQLIGSNWVEGVVNDAFADIYFKFVNADIAMHIAFQYGAAESDFNFLYSFELSKAYVYELAEDLDNVGLELQEGDSAASVTKPVRVWSGNLGIGWYSTQPRFLSQFTPFDRPALGEGDVEAEVIVTLFKHSYQAIKKMAITLKEWDSKVAYVDSLRSDLVLVEFDHPVAARTLSEFGFDHGLEVKKITQYPQFPKLVLLTVEGQEPGVEYRAAFKNMPTDITFIGREANASACDESTCSIPRWGKIPIPGVPVPGSVSGRVVDSFYKPLAGATVTLTGTNIQKTVVTDYKGDFEIADVLPEISYTITATSQGYSTHAIQDIKIAPGQPFGFMMLTIYTTPNPVKNLHAFHNNEFTLNLIWNYEWNGVPNKYSVTMNGEKINEVEASAINIDSLQPGKTYTFSVAACNDLGCSEPVELTYTMPLVLQIHSITPFNSATEQTYEELKQIEKGTYVWPASLEAADALLIKFKDNDYVSGSVSPLLAGILDYSQKNILLLIQGVPTDPIIMQDKENNLIIKLDKKTNEASVYYYIIGGLKYQIDSKQFDILTTSFQISKE